MITEIKFSSVAEKDKERYNRLRSFISGGYEIFSVLGYNYKLDVQNAADYALALALETYAIEKMKEAEEKDQEAKKQIFMDLCEDLNPVIKITAMNLKDLISSSLEMLVRDETLGE